MMPLQTNFDHMRATDMYSAATDKALATRTADDIVLMRTSSFWALHNFFPTRNLWHLEGRTYLLKDDLLFETTSELRKLCVPLCCVCVPDKPELLCKITCFGCGKPFDESFSACQRCFDAVFCPSCGPTCRGEHAQPCNELRRKGLEFVASLSRQPGGRAFRFVLFAAGWMIPRKLTVLPERRHFRSDLFCVGSEECRLYCAHPILLTSLIKNATQEELDDVVATVLDEPEPQKRGRSKAQKKANRRARQEAEEAAALDALRAKEEQERIDAVRASLDNLRGVAWDVHEADVDDLVALQDLLLDMQLASAHTLRAAEQVLGQAHAEKRQLLKAAAKREEDADRAHDGKGAECPLCFAEQTEMACCVPCGHAACAGCTRALAGKTCPFCNRKVDNTMRIYI